VNPWTLIVTWQHLMSDKLQLALLGNVEIRRDGNPVTDFSSSKAQALLCYLADLGAEFGAPFAVQFPEFGGRSLHLKTVMAAIHAYERPLA
jgi:hypothetical protein